MNKELQELRKKNIDQLNAELVATRQEQFNLRIKHKTGQLNETNQLTIARKKIAKIKTLKNLQEKLPITPVITFLNFKILKYQKCYHGSYG
jgi:large subunit ribosomal protein L29